MDFQHTKLSPFQTLSLGFILKIFLKFHKFQPQYLYKIYSFRKIKECSVLFVIFKTYFVNSFVEVHLRLIK